MSCRSVFRRASPSNEHHRLSGLHKRARADILVRAMVLASMLLGWLARPPAVYALTYTVNSANDVDDGACNATHCSLREAINAANTNPGPDTINFSIPGVGARVINASPMPALTGAGTTINGTSQPGYAGAPIVEVTGDGPESAPGFRVYAADITIRGLAITEWSPGGIIVEGAAVTNVIIEDNYIGLRTDGTTPLANASIGGVGVFGGAAGTQIRDNVISANVDDGIILAETCPGFCTAPSASPSGTVVENNKIGTNAGGTLALGNSGDGIKVQGAIDTFILDNLISANAVSGITVQDATSITIQGNKIGTDVSGTIGLGTIPVAAGIGVSVLGTSSSVLIGGAAYSMGNLISGNYSRGLDLVSPGTEVAGNFIGTDVSGMASLPNGIGGGPAYGVWAGGGSNDSFIHDNVICEGVLVAGYGTGPVLGTVIQANRIGTNVDGTAAICDSSVILSDGTEGAQVLANVISGSSLAGVQIEFSSTYNILRGNFIGTDAAGASLLGGHINGVAVSGALAIGNIIGGPGPGDGNLIAGNGTGINVSGGAPGTSIQGNKIGTDLSGNLALGNSIGISVWASSGTLIGGSAPGEGNLVSGNAGPGIYLSADGTQVLGNTIGLAADESALGNAVYGIDISGNGNIIGGAGLGEGNNISSNAWGGIHLSTGTGNLIAGNIIGQDGSANPRGNGDPAANIGFGIGLFDDGNMASQNTISYSGYSGIEIQGSGNVASGNKIHHNHMFGVTVLSGTGNTLSENSIYDNGSLGIDLATFPSGPDNVALNDPADADSGPNDLLNFPEFTAGTTAVVGTACPNCTVEVFVAAMDPSGYGEGKTFITAVAADASGDFEAPLGSTFICARITATATDEAGNTSEFSEAVFREGCIVLPPLLVVIWPPGLLVFAIAAASLIGMAVHRPVRWFALGGAAAGGFLGVAFLAAIALLPNLTVDVPQAPAPEPGPPTCSFYLEERLNTPPNGAVFEPNDELVLAWTPRANLPPGQIRWVVEILSRQGPLASQITPDNRLPLSAFGIDTGTPGIYIWHVSGERAEPGSDLWQPLCGKSAGGYFLIAGPAPAARPVTFETSTPTPPAPPTFTATPTPVPTLVPVTIPPSLPTETFTPKPPPPPQDNEGPGIKNVSASPDPIFAVKPKGCKPTTSTVFAAVSDPSGVANVEMIYKGIAAGSVPMINVGGNQWQAQLGPFDAAGTANYRIRAFDQLGNQSVTQFQALTVLACIP